MKTHIELEFTKWPDMSQDEFECCLNCGGCSSGDRTCCPLIRGLVV